jgi:hypothetical protein
MKIPPKPRRGDVQHAVRDLRNRTLVAMERPLDRLIYLASTRDYNTGLYRHDGLSVRYSSAVACEALADCHREAFQELLRCSVKELVLQLEEYMRSARIDAAEFFKSWNKLEPYRVAVPVDTDPLAADFLYCNLKTALAILETRLPQILAAPIAWPHRSPAR